jgi:hypothetical protein
MASPITMPKYFLQFRTAHRDVPRPLAGTHRRKKGPSFHAKKRFSPENKIQLFSGTAILSPDNDSGSGIPRLPWLLPA